MKILLFGAGALGTLYAAKLRLAGADVAIYARGARLAALQSSPVRIDRVGGARATVTVPIVGEIERATDYDVVIVLVRKQQLQRAIADLAPHLAPAANVVVMVNTALGYSDLQAALGDKLIVGFSGAACAILADGTLRYTIAPSLFQPTVFGDPEGGTSARVARIAAAIRRAGFPVQERIDMAPWQRSHAAWMGPLLLAGLLPTLRLHGLLASVRAAKECLALVHQHAPPLAPSGLRFVAWVPAHAVALLLRMLLALPPLRAAFIKIARDSADESLTLCSELEELAANAGAQLPATRALLALVAAVNADPK
jgi:2-dehydropantoate 2-reductase